jgi:hypothetical protein
VVQLIQHENDNLSDYLAHQIQALAKIMRIETQFVLSSRCYENNNLSGEERILDICKREGAAKYLNPQGGKMLYDTKTFHTAGIDLCFIATRPLPYQQRVAGFVPYLSIIDALMEIGPTEMRHHLDSYDITP